MFSSAGVVPSAPVPPPWRLEELVRFGGGLMIAFGAMFIGSLALSMFVPDLSRPDALFAQHITGWVLFHGGILWLTDRMIRTQATTWGDAFGMDRFRAVKPGLLVGLGVLVSALLLAELSTRVLRSVGLPADSQESVKLLREGLTPLRLVLFGLGAVILAPVAEEVLFRGVVFRALAERGWIKTAYFGSAGLFAVVHLNFAGTLSFMLIGLAAAWLYRRTGSLLAPIALHVLFNAVNFFMLVAPPDWLKPHVNG